MFENKRELENKSRRIKELEDILCPFNQHDWIIIDEHSLVDDSSLPVIDTYRHRTLQCKRCRKIVYDNDKMHGFDYKIKSV